jgi:iron(II)-dependent oxidoreductase
VPGGSFLLGASREEPFVFDNEKWAHRLEVRPFAIARAPVTQGEFLAFVEEGGYARPELWSEAGWRWRDEQKARAPWYWRREAGGKWMRRRYDAWIPLDPDLPVVHVCFFEAEAYCRFARRRLPSELEWEVAAAGEPSSGGDALGATKRRFPWGEAAPRPELAHLDWRGGDVASVHAYGPGDSAFGCRQMLGNVWEWTASDFGPYQGFAADPYKEYSEPWFHTRKVLRGGAWATRGRLLRNTWRNFFEPWRRDVWAGFRTCALVS